MAQRIAAPRPRQTARRAAYQARVRATVQSRRAPSAPRSAGQKRRAASSAEKRRMLQLLVSGALLMLALLLILKKPDSSEKSVDVKRFTDLEVDHVGDIRNQGEGFDFTWD